MSNIPPIQFELPPKIEAEVPGANLSRVWLGWVLLALIFVALIGNSFSAASGKHILEGSKDSKTRDKMVRMMLGLKALQPSTGAKQEAFADYIDGLKDDAKKSMDAKKLRVALRAEDDKAPFGDDLKELAASKDPQDQAFAALYNQREIKKADAEPLLAKLDQKDLGEEIATVQFKEKFGDKEARKKAFPSEPAMRLGVVGFLGCSGFLAGIFVLAMFTSQRLSGGLKPFGMPQQGVPLPVADRLALCAAILMCTYLGTGVLSALVFKNVPVLPQVFPYAMIFVAIGVITAVPIMGHRFTLSSLGINKDGLGKRFLWGFCGSLAMIPILLVAVAIVAALSRILPGNAHPVGQEALDATGPQAIALLLFAAVVAPIWEEIMFRGLLFPALSIITKNPIWGALISSFAFAAIHPQGPAGIPLLMSLALAMCFISYQTKSLIPNIVMHALNNGGALLAVMLLGKEFL